MSHSPQNLYKKHLGTKGEKLALKYLKKQGCKLIERNYRTPFGEADLIVRDREEVVFVEVKTRTTEEYGLPSEAVDKEKQRRYYRIAQCYWKRTQVEPNARFDVVEVYGDGRIEHIKNAF